MIKCISSLSLQPGPDGAPTVAEGLAQARQAGFEGLELGIGTEGPLTVQTPRGDCEAIRAEIGRSGLVVETVATGLSWGTNPISDDPAVRERSLALHEAALQRTAWLGCSAMLYVPGVVKSPISPELIRYDRAVQRAREAVARLLETAERCGVDLCVENVWNGLFYSPLELCQFVDAFGSERLKVYLDVGNLPGYHQHPPHWVQLLGPRIGRVHLKDFKTSVGTLDGFCDLLAGDVPWPETMAALREIGYDRTLVAEMMPADPALLARTRAAMDCLLAM